MIHNILPETASSNRVDLLAVGADVKLRVGAREHTLTWDELRYLAVTSSAGYAAILRVAEKVQAAREDARVEARRLAAVRACTGHKAVRETVRGYTGGVAVHLYKEQEPRAAGGITLHQTCACGAERRVNENAGYQELGVWG